MAGGAAACWSVALSALERLRRHYVVPARAVGVLAGLPHGVNAGDGDDGAGDVGLGGLILTTRALPSTNSAMSFSIFQLTGRHINTCRPCADGGDGYGANWVWHRHGPTAASASPAGRDKRIFTRPGGSPGFGGKTGDLVVESVFISSGMALE